MDEKLITREIFKQYANEGYLKYIDLDSDNKKIVNIAKLIKDYQELGYKSLNSSLILVMHAHLWGFIFTLVNFGNAAQLNQFLPCIHNGSIIGGHAITEPSIGSDVSYMQTSYEVNNNMVKLNGKKRWITNAPIADYIVVYARSDSNDISAFIVHCSDHGVEFKNGPKSLAFAQAPIGDINLNNVEIPIERLIGKIGAGKIMIQVVLEYERAFLFSGFIGVMKRLLKDATDYLKNRYNHIYKNGLLDNPIIQHQLVQLSAQITSAEMLINQCAEKVSLRKRFTRESSLTKWQCSEIFSKVITEIILLLGAHGLAENNPIYFQTLADALGSQILSGTTNIQKNILAGIML